MKARGNSNEQYNGNTGVVGSLGYEVQVSLLELLQKEDALTKQLNTANHALVLASKTGGRLSEYKRDVNQLTIKLDDTREDIKNYLLSTLGVQVTGLKPKEKPTVSKVYAEREKMINSLYND